MYCCAFNHSFAQNMFFFKTKVIFIQGTFKNIQGLLWKIQGLFTDIQQFSNFQGVFKACANHAMDNTRTAWSKTEILQRAFRACKP